MFDENSSSVLRRFDHRLKGCLNVLNREFNDCCPFIISYNYRKLERQCISVISFGSSSDILDCPIWILCINVVAMEMLRSKIPPSK